MYGLNAIVWLLVRFRLVGLVFCWWVMCFGCGFRLWFGIWFLGLRVWYLLCIVVVF